MSGEIESHVTRIGLGEGGGGGGKGWKGGGEGIFYPWKTTRFVHTVFDISAILARDQTVFNSTVSPTV